MTLTFVVVCSKCGGLTLAKADQKTRTCPYCGATIIPERAKKLGSANTSREASTLLQKIKTQHAQKRQNGSTA